MAQQFICKVKEGEIIPSSPFKKDILIKMLQEYEEKGTTIKVTFEHLEKNINAEQKKLYKAFILRVGEHFGSDYKEAESYIARFAPDKPLDRWSSKELDSFMTKASVFLADFGFHF